MVSIKLILAQQDEWDEYFNQYRQACQELSDQIAATDNEIDQRVFDLYGLTPEEKEIVMQFKSAASPEKDTDDIKE